MTHAGLRLRRCDDHGLTKGLRSFCECGQTWCIDAIIIREQELHGEALSSHPLRFSTASADHCARWHDLADLRHSAIWPLLLILGA
jgi:hypothetical protein